MGRRRAELLDKDIFTTYDAARICSANIASIKNWIAKGLLKAFRTPGGHYRIRRRDLQLFIQKYNMPNPFLDRAEKCVYVLDLDRPSVKRMMDALAGNRVTYFDNPLSALLRIGLERPDLLVLALNLGDISGEDLVDLLLAEPETRNIRILIYTGVEDEETAARLRKKGVAEILSKGLALRELRRAVTEHLGA